MWLVSRSSVHMTTSPRLLPNPRMVMLSVRDILLEKRHRKLLRKKELNKCRVHTHGLKLSSFLQAEPQLALKGI